VAGASIGAGICLALAIALLLPAGAVAKGGFLLPPSGSGPEFSLGRGSATRLAVSTEGQRVTLSVSREGQFVDYEVRGRVARGGIRADLGHAGSVDVEFQPLGPPEAVEPPPFCTGRPETVRDGVFVGAIDFVGRNHFVDFRAKRARGTVSRPGKLRCHLPGGPHRHPKPEEGGEAGMEVALTASSTEEGLLFLALTDRSLPRSITAFAAISRETVGRVRISRFVLIGSGRPADFTFDEALTMARAAPSAPFHGSATFQRGAPGSTPSWSGTLRVAFLDGEVALTGTDFAATLGVPRTIGGGGRFTGSFFGERPAPRRRLADRGALSIPWPDPQR